MMKYLNAILFMILAATASASVINTNDMRPRSSYPTRIGATYNPTLSQLREAGWREYVPCTGVEGSNIVSTTYSDDGDTVTASCEYAEAIPYVEPPAEFPAGIISEGRIVAQGVDIEATTPDTGYILTDASTNKWLISIADGEVIGVQISASPEISMEDRRARLQAERIRRQTIKDELNLTEQQIDLIRQWAAADVDTLFSGMTAQQRRFMKIQHQLVRMLAKRELKEIGDQQ